MGRLHPRQNQKARVVGDEAEVTFAGFHTPADIAVTAAQMPRRRTPRHAGDRSSLRPDQILQMLAYRLLVAKVVMMLDEAIEQRFIGRAADLLYFQRSQLLQGRDYRCRVDLDRRGTPPRHQRIVWHEAYRGKFDLTGTVQHQQ